MMVVKCRVKSGKVGISRVKSGKVGRKFFFLVIVVVTLLHQFLRVWRLFPVLAGSLRYSSTTLTDDSLMPVSWHRGHGVVSGRLESGKVGSKSGQSGQFSLFWSFALDFAHVSLVSLLGTGQLTLLQGPCFAVRFPASGSHDDMMTRSQQCIFAFWHRAIISLLYHCF